MRTSLLIGNRRLAWIRYWVPWDGHVHSGWDGTGYLTDPADRYGRGYNPQLRSIEELLQRPFLVLSGQPGIGKTQVVRELRENWSKNRRVDPNEELIFIDGRNLDGTTAIYRSTVDSSRWKGALAEGKSIRLLIDGVDEALVRHVDVTSILFQALQDQPLDRIKVILVCRAAEWCEEEGIRFSRLWIPDNDGVQPDVKIEASDRASHLATAIVWELCHLTQSDVEMAAQATGIESTSFLSAVARRKVQPLAARPVTLKMLLDEFPSDPSLNASFHDIYGRSVLRICGEVNEERERYTMPYPAREEVFKTASRLAACLILGRRSVIIKTTATSEDPGVELLASCVEGQDVAAGRAFNITREKVNFTLDTPLFSFRGPNYGFEQKTYAEFLAADYLTGCSLDQLRSLFCANIEGREMVARQLAEVAAWIAVHHPAWCRHLSTVDPEVMLRTDLSPLTPELKAFFVESLLKNASTCQAFDHQGLSKFYATLNHPSLASQLRPYIADEGFNLVVRRMAIDIAGDCGLTELEEDLWARVEVDDSAIYWIGSALRGLTGLHSSEKLLSVLAGKLSVSAYNSLGGTALTILVPAQFSVRDVLPYIKRNRKRLTSGSLDVACSYHLVKHMQVEDLAPILHWLIEIPDAFDSVHSLNRLAEHTFAFALRHVENEAIAEAVAALWLDRAEHHRPQPTGKYEFEANNVDSIGLDVRSNIKALAGVLVQYGAIEKCDPFILFRDLLGQSDVPWLLEELSRSAAVHVNAWSIICVSVLTPASARKSAELVNSLYEKFPEFRAKLPPAEPNLDFVTTFERSIKRWEDERKDHFRREARKHPERPNRKAVIKELLLHPSANRTEWVSMCEWFWMDQEHDPKEESSEHGDVRTSPGWKEFDVLSQEKLCECACAFLLSKKDTRRGLNAHSNYTQAAYLGIRLLFSEFIVNTTLGEDILKRWGRVIFDALYDESDEHAEIVAWALKQLPQLGKQFLLAKTKQSDERGFADFALRPFRFAWSENLGDGISRALIRGRYSIRSSFRILSWLFEHSPSTAQSIVTRIVRRRSSPLSQLHRVLILCARLRRPIDYWRTLEHLTNLESAAALRTDFLGVINDLSDEREFSLSSLFDDDLLGELGLILFRLFPPMDDPRHDSGNVYEVKPLDQIVSLRRGIVEALLSRGTVSSARALLVIAKTLPSPDCLWLQMTYSSALRSIADSAVPPRTPIEIANLARTTHAIFIDQEEDLARLVVASLERLQVRMTSRSTEWRAVWNDDLHLPRFERKHESGMTPRVEDALSDTVAQWLRQDIGHSGHLVLNREVEVSRNRVVDILIDATTHDNNRSLKVAIEAKRCIHPEVKTAAKTQLVERYLIPHTISHGVYLVGWYRGAWTPTRAVWNPGSYSQAVRDVKYWASEATTNDTKVIPFVLDCTGGP